MITDTNSIVGFAYDTMIGSVGGDWILLGILVFAVIGIALIMGRAKASTVLMVGVSMAFVFGLLIPSAFMFIFWIAIIGAVFVLINGLRKWITGQ